MLVHIYYLRNHKIHAKLKITKLLDNVEYNPNSRTPSLK